MIWVPGLDNANDSIIFNTTINGQYFGLGLNSVSGANITQVTIIGAYHEGLSFNLFSACIRSITSVWSSWSNWSRSLSISYLYKAISICNIKCRISNGFVTNANGLVNFAFSKTSFSLCAVKNMTGIWYSVLIFSAVVIPSSSPSITTGMALEDFD